MGPTQASERGCFIESCSDITFQTASQSWDQGWESSCDNGGKWYRSPHTQGSVVGVPASGRCGPKGIALEGPRPSAAGESQGVAAHGSPEAQPAASATRGVHHRDVHGSHSISSQPALLALQQLAVGGDLDVQGQLDVHELLVLAQLPGHVLLGPLQGGLQLLLLGASILEGQLPTVLSFGDGGLQLSTSASLPNAPRLAQEAG
uniref:Uncharacterized protein n=1 Tax=Sus scrofa TaxID=9823 RepID=A0A480HRF2_PIG